jgi:hypothetical protein
MIRDNPMQNLDRRNFPRLLTVSMITSAMGNPFRPKEDNVMLGKSTIAIGVALMLSAISNARAEDPDGDTVRRIGRPSVQQNINRPVTPLSEIEKRWMNYQR